MKSYIMRNRFFVFLLSFALIVIASLSVYIVKNNLVEKEATPSTNTSPVDTNKIAEITAFSGNYSRSSTALSGNAITISWAYSANASHVERVLLYLNENDPIDVTSNSYYDFTQSVYDFPTGNNTVRLVLQLKNGETIEKELTVFVDYIMSVKQEIVQEDNVLMVTLEYVYHKDHIVEMPDVLITGNDSEVMPAVAYIETQTNENQNKVTARTTYSFRWNSEAEISKKMNVRWKFNVTKDSFDFIVRKPQK